MLRFLVARGRAEKKHIPGGREQGGNKGREGGGGQEHGLGQKQPVFEIKGGGLGFGRFQFCLQDMLSDIQLLTDGGQFHFLEPDTVLELTAHQIWKNSQSPKMSRKWRLWRRSLFPVLGPPSPRGGSRGQNMAVRHFLYKKSIQTPPSRGELPHVSNCLLSVSKYFFKGDVVLGRVH